MASVVVTLLLGHVASDRIGRREARRAGEQIIRDYLEQAIQDGKIDRFEAEGLVQYGHHLLGPPNTRNEAESYRAYIQRLARSVGFSIPAESDWSEVEPK